MLLQIAMVLLKFACVSINAQQNNFLLILYIDYFFSKNNTQQNLNMEWLYICVYG